MSASAKHPTATPAGVMEPDEQKIAQEHVKILQEIHAPKSLIDLAQRVAAGEASKNQK